MIESLMRLFGFRKRSRHIFRFRAGRRLRYADPVYIALTLAEHPDYLPRHLAEARAGNLDAIEICGRAACDAFGVESIESSGTQGMTLADRVKLIHDFDTWKILLKQKHDAFCRLSAIHGCDIGNLDSERFCALYFSRIESEVRIAETIRLGNRAGVAKLPIGWFMATRDTIDEATAAHETHVASIIEANVGGGA